MLGLQIERAPHASLAPHDPSPRREVGRSHLAPASSRRLEQVAQCLPQAHDGTDASTGTDKRPDAGQLGGRHRA